MVQLFFDSILLKANSKPCINFSMSYSNSISIWLCFKLIYCIKNLFNWYMGSANSKKTSIIVKNHKSSQHPKTVLTISSPTLSLAIFFLTYLSNRKLK